MGKYLILGLIALSACAKRGDRGHPGVDGIPGTPGSSCSTTQTLTGAIISCTDGTTSVIMNGTNGADGINAPPTAYSIVELLNPCGASGGFDEVLLRTHNNQLIAHFSSGNLQFLTLLTPGSYRTTDAQNCNFTVHANMTVTW